jgi:hypothetical protein
MAFWSNDHLQEKLSVKWTFDQMNFGSNDLVRSFYSVKWHFLSKEDSVIWPFGKMNFRSNGIRSNGVRSNGLSVKWPFGQKISVKWFFGKVNCLACSVNMWTYENYMGEIFSWEKRRNLQNSEFLFLGPKLLTKYQTHQNCSRVNIFAQNLYFPILSRSLCFKILSSQLSWKQQTPKKCQIRSWFSHFSPIRFYVKF